MGLLGVDERLVAPVEPAALAGGPAVAVDALLRGGLGRGPQDGEQPVGEEGRDLRRRREPAVHVPLHEERVRRAQLFALAAYLVGDAVREEGLQQGVGELFGAVTPDVGAVGLGAVSAILQHPLVTGKPYVVVHERSTLCKGCSIVRPLKLRNIGAVVIDVGTVVHSPRLGIDEADARQPVPGLLSIVGERVIAGEPGEARPHVEEACIGHR